MIKYIKYMIADMSSENFNKLKELSSPIIEFRELKNDAITKDVYIEKIYDYIEKVEIKNNKEIEASTYTNVFFRIINQKSKIIQKDTRAYEYFNRLKQVYEYIKNGKTIEFDKYKDFTRTFASIYEQIVMNENLVSNINFDKSYDKLSLVIEYLKSQKVGRFTKESLMNLDDKYSINCFSYLSFLIIYLNMLTEKEN